MVNQRMVAMKTMFLRYEMFFFEPTQHPQHSSSTTLLPQGTGPACDPFDVIQVICFTHRMDDYDAHYPVAPCAGPLPVVSPNNFTSQCFVLCYKTAAITPVPHTHIIAVAHQKT